jgi:hypothetical protein
MFLIGQMEILKINFAGGSRPWVMRGRDTRFDSGVTFCPIQFFETRRSKALQKGEHYSFF